MATRGPREAIVAVVEHSAHGRVRIRLQKPHRTPGNFERVRRHLAANPEIHDVRVNERSGSLLVQGSSAEAVYSLLAEVVDLLQPLAGESTLEPEIAALVDAVKAVDSRLRGATGGRLSMRWLVPATFISMGARQLLQQGLTLGNVPWYVLVYYGVDSFMKLYPDHAPRPTIAAVREVHK